MYMKDMNTQLEKRGFKVRRDYVRDDQSYVFTISKDGHHTKMVFECRPHEDPFERNYRQKQFIEDLVAEHEKNVKYFTNIPLTASPGFDTDGLYVNIECLINKPKFHTHDYVRVVSGPYEGFEGRIKEHFTDKRIYKINNPYGDWYVKESELEKLDDSNVAKNTVREITNSVYGFTSVATDIKEGEKNMNKFKIGDGVRITKGLLEGFFGTIEQIVPSSEFPGQYKFRVHVPGLVGTALNIHHENPYYNAWELMLRDDESLYPRLTHPGFYGWTMHEKRYGIPEIKEVKFNGPDTIVLWATGSKTSIKDCNRILDREKSLSMAIAYKHIGIKDIIFNAPATIVFWDDGTKTIVKAYNEDYDPEKGLAMAITKKCLGNKGNYFNKLKKWLPKEEE